MRRHSLGVFERAAGFEIGGQACGPECVTAELDFATDLGRPAPDHAVGVDPVHRVDGQRVGFAGRRAEEGPLGVAGDAGSGDVFVEEHLQLVDAQASRAVCRPFRAAAPRFVCPGGNNFRPA
jgi:hypothetical protein